MDDKVFLLLPDRIQSRTPHARIESNYRPDSTSDPVAGGTDQGTSELI